MKCPIWGVLELFAGFSTCEVSSEVVSNGKLALALRLCGERRVTVVFMSAMPYLAYYNWAKVVERKGDGSDHVVSRGTIFDFIVSVAKVMRRLIYVLRQTKRVISKDRTLIVCANCFIAKTLIR